MIFALLNQKGGVGKTTLAVHVATALAKRGRRIMLVDSDPQGSALDWSASRQAVPLFPVIGLPRPNLHKEVPAHASRYDDVVIDGPPRVNELTRSALLVADMVLIPVQPSPYDIWAVADLVDLIKARQEVTDGKPKAAFLISRAIKRTVLGRELVAALGEYGLPVFDSGTVQRQSYPRTAAEGRTVLEDGSKDAAAEINAITDEMLARFGGGHGA